MSVLEKELLHVAPRICILSALFYLVLCFFGYYDVGVIISVILGTLYGVLNFFLIGVAVENAVLKEPKKAQAYMVGQYFMRYIMSGIVIYLSFKVSFLNPLATIMPMFFVRIIITYESIFARKGG